MANIIPTILTDRIQKAQQQLDSLAGVVEMAQIDLMDGQFVSTVSIKPSEVGELKAEFPLEAHLMVKSPQDWLPFLRPELFRRIYFHIEAVPDAEDLIATIKELDIEPGLAINVGTPIETLERYVDTVDSVLFMAIEPGRQEQQFQPEVLEKIDEFLNLHPEHLVAIDGGINSSNIVQVVKSGAYNLSIGSAIFGSGNPKQNIEKLKDLI